MVCWWPHSSFVLYNGIRKYNICSRIKCQLGTCAQHPASTPERVGLLYKWKQNNSKRYQYIKNVSLKLLFWAKYEWWFWQLWVYYQWRNQDDHWDATLDFNTCGTAPWTDIHHQLLIYLFYLFYFNHYLNHWWLILTIFTKYNGNNFLTLEQLHTFFKLFFSNCDFILQYCSLWIWYQSS